MILFHSSLIPLQVAGLTMMPMLVWAIFWLERDWRVPRRAPSDNKSTPLA